MHKLTEFGGDLSGTARRRSGTTCTSSRNMPDLQTCDFSEIRWLGGERKSESQKFAARAVLARKDAKTRLFWPNRAGRTQAPVLLGQDQPARAGLADPARFNHNPGRPAGPGPGPAGPGPGPASCPWTWSSWPWTRSSQLSLVQVQLILDQDQPADPWSRSS